MAMRTRAELRAALVALACDAGESGFALAEVGITLIVRAGAYPLAVKSLLATLGTVVLTLLDVVSDRKSPV